MTKEEIQDALFAECVAFVHALHEMTAAGSITGQSIVEPGMTIARKARLLSRKIKVMQGLEAK